MQCTDVVSQALVEAACRVRAIRDLTRPGVASHLDVSPEQMRAAVNELAARTAMFLAVAQERGEAA